MASHLDHITNWNVRAGQARFTVRNLAALCQVSNRQLERFFKQRFEQSPELWLKHVRLWRAQALLADGLSVKETAYAVGFKQVSHFCREFKRLTGITPFTFEMTDCSRRIDGKCRVGIINVA